MEYVGKHRKEDELPTVDHIANLLLPIGWDTQDPAVYLDATFKDVTPKPE